MCLNNKYRRYLSGFIIIFSLTAIQVQAQSVSKKDYQRADKFIYQNVGDLVFRMNVNPHWADDAPIFWYRVHSRKGQEYFIVNADQRNKKTFFNQQKLAKNLSDVLGEKIDPYDLPLHNLDWDHADNSFRFQNDGTTWKVDLNTLAVTKVNNHSNRSSNRLSSTSPDGKWTVERDDYNLFLINNETGKRTQLTKDGQKLFFYGAYLPWTWEREVGPVSKKREPLPLRISWSKDSKKFYAGKLDLRTAKKMYLLQNAPQKGFRSKVFSYYRALPGEVNVAKIQPFVFDVESKNKTPLDVQPYNQISNGSWMWYGDGSSTLYGIMRERGYGSVTLLKADAATGKVDTVFHRSSDTYIDPLNSGFEFLPKTNEFLWLSERDGWNHIYLYDLKTGKVKRQITHGHYVVKDLVHVDRQNRTIYFTAGGKEPNQDPYYNHLYRVNFDGSDLTSLSPENATHDVSLSPNQKYFVDHYSRVDKKTVTVLRSTKDGSVLMHVEEADIKDLLATGWQYPEPFKLKARDGKTDIYGVIFRPSNFSSAKSYPVIDDIYAGPQAVKTPKSFRRGLYNSDQPQSELGFIVINVDGLGTAQRSKAFHDYSYKNLGDMGLPDHVKTIKELAQKYSYMDTSRVGIYGHSAGGYDAARAMFLRPDFFKVGVAESGDHDLRVAKAWWPELYMDYPAGPQYAEQSNMNPDLVDNLKGYLLLAHGDMDTNVHPSETYRLAEALIKAGKSFDMFIIPNVSHGYGYASTYFMRRRMNYFVEHLLGAKPLRNYQFK